MEKDGSVIRPFGMVKGPSNASSLIHPIWILWLITRYARVVDKIRSKGYNVIFSGECIFPIPSNTFILPYCLLSSNKALCFGSILSALPNGSAIITCVNTLTGWLEGYAKEWGTIYASATIFWGWYHSGSFSSIYRQSISSYVLEIY